MAILPQHKQLIVDALADIRRVTSTHKLETAKLSFAAGLYVTLMGPDNVKSKVINGLVQQISDDEVVIDSLIDIVDTLLTHI